MDDLLFLSQRIPFPPDKGDKIRSYHVLKHLAGRFRVHLGCFIDDPADQKYVGHLGALCASVHTARLSPATKMLRGIGALLSGIAITEACFLDRDTMQWIARTVADNRIGNVFAFGSAMVPLAEKIAARKILDVVDVDSEKWRAYAKDAVFPMSAIYNREARKVLEMERRGTTAFDHSLFVSRGEVEAFLRHVPGAAGRVLAMQNGVDFAYFDPATVTLSPFPAGAKSIVFTGTMNYRPNIDAVAYFARDVLPAVVASVPEAQFWIVGSLPSPQVKALANGSTIHVTGAVPDIRPYLQNADCVVAPLAIARGVQNKVLEAMAMARPVVASAPAAEGISARAGEEIVVANGSFAFADAVCDVLAGRFEHLGERSRARVCADYRWASNLKILDVLFS